MNPLPKNEQPKNELPKAKVAGFEAVVRSLSAALGTTAMYPAGHPMRTEAAKAAKAGVDAWFRAETSLDIGFSPDNVLIGGRSVKEKDSLFGDVADHFHSRGVLAIALTRSTSVEELTALFDALSDTPDAIAASGGVARRMRPSAHIKLKEIDYGAILEGFRRQAASDPMRIWESLCRMSDDLRGGGVTGPSLDVLVSKLGNARTVAAAFNAAFARAGKDGAAVAGKICGMLGGKATPEQTRAVRKSLGAIAANLSPDLAAALVREGSDEATSSMLHDAFVESLTDETMTETILSLMGREGKIDSRLATLFDKLSAQPAKSRAVAPRVAEGLRKITGGSAEGMLQIQEALLTAMKTTDRGAFMSQVYRLMVDMITTRAGLPAGLSERLAPLLREYERMAETNAGTKQAWTELILNILWFENDTANFEAFNERLFAVYGEDAGSCDERLLRCALKLFAAKMEQGKTPEAIVQSSAQSLRRFGRMAGASRMVSLIAGADEVELRGLRRALDGIEANSAEGILDAFLHERDGGMRQKFAAMLWDVSFTQKQMKAIVKSLGRERSPKDRDAVLAALLNASDATRPDRLFACLREGLLVNKHLGALVRVCGERRMDNTVRHLGAILAARPRLDWRGYGTLRVAAAVSLGQIGSSEALGVLNGCAGDKDPAVRKACERALEASRAK